MNHEYEVFPTTRAVRVYLSDMGFLVIEQEQEDHRDGDQSILIPPAYIKAFVKAVQEAAKGK